MSFVPIPAAEVSVTTNLHIKLFGDFCITAAGVPLTSVNSERLQALLAFIVLHRDAPQSRQQIAVQLWPDASDADAKANLRRRLHELKQLLPEGDRWLKIETKTVQWLQSQQSWVDVVEFETILTQSHSASPLQKQQLLEQAAHLYQGNLLPGCYDDWIVPYRDQFQQQAIAGLEALVALAAKVDSPLAIRYAQQLQRLDPLYEPTYRHLMWLHAQQGDRASALRVYHQCMTVLQSELGVNPSCVTGKLYEQILNLDDRAPEAQVTAITLDQVTPDQVTPDQVTPDQVTPAQTIQNLEIERSATADRPQPQLAACILPEFKPSAAEKSPFPATLPTPAIPLIGRATEWTAIQQWKQRRQQGTRPELLLLVGEPGIGKTRLLEELAHQVGREDSYVVWGRGFEAEQLRPYGIWIDAFRSIQAHEFLAEITALLKAQSTEYTLNRSCLFDAGVACLQHLATHHDRVLIVLDDIQWLDEASVAFLHYAVRLLSQAAIVFACAARKQELEQNLTVSKVLQAFHREQWLQRLEVSPLDSNHTAKLAHLISQEIDAEQVFTGSGGNPLFVLEVARALSQAPQAGSHQQFSNDLTTLIQGRLLPLDDNARQLVSWAAALGRSFSPTTLAQVANYSPPQLLAALEQLEQHRIIRPGNPVKGEQYYDFAHDIIRQVAYQQLSEPRRRLVHYHIAQALTQMAANPAEVGNVAYHASLGGNHQLAASASLEAAERHLRLFAYTEAAEVAQQGMRHCQYLEASAQISLHLSLLRTYVRAGVRKDKVAALEAELHQLIGQAFARGLKEAEAIGLEVLIMLSYDHGNLTQVYHHSLQAAETARLANPTTTAYMLARTGSCLAEIGREMARAEALLLEAQSLAERVGLQMLDIPAGLGFVHRYQGQTEMARTELEQGWKLAQFEQDHWRECNCLVNLVLLELETGNPANALYYCDELTTVSAQMGEGSEAPHAAALNAVIQYLLGTPEADQILARSQQSLQQLDSPRMLAHVQTIAAEFDLQQSRSEQAIDRAKTALAAAEIVKNPSEIALAWAVMILANLQLGNQVIARQQWQDLQQIAQAPLSYRAQQALQTIREQLHCIAK